MRFFRQPLYGSFIVFILFFALLSMASKAAELAIIIDDIGYLPSDRQVLDLPPQVTISVLPQTPYGKRIAKQAYQGGREVMLHIPMQALSGKKLGPGAMTADMSDAQLIQVFNQHMQELPFVRGVNNHMGSRLTQMRQPMQTLMQQIKKHDLYFVDSRTTRFTKAEQIATEVGVTNWRRHVFLDPVQSVAVVERQFAAAVRRAQKRGFAIAIGHPYPETMQVLKRELANLDSIVLANLSTVSPRQVSDRLAMLEAKQGASE